MMMAVIRPMMNAMNNPNSDTRVVNQSAVSMGRRCSGTISDSVITVHGVGSRNDRSPNTYLLTTVHSTKPMNNETIPGIQFVMNLGTFNFGFGGAE